MSFRDNGFAIKRLRQASEPGWFRSRLNMRLAEQRPPGLNHGVYWHPGGNMEYECTRRHLEHGNETF